MLYESMSRLLPHSLLFISLVFITACNAPDKSAEWQSMTLIKSKPEHVLVDDLDGTREHGEKIFYEASLSDQAGKPVGQLLAEHVIVDLPGEDGVGSPT